jgi:hypothetical protein
MAPVVVARDGTMRWAGPVRISRSHPVGSLLRGRPSRLPLTVGGESSDVRCQATWELVTPDDGMAIASGSGGRCGTAVVTIPADVIAGSYRLDVVAHAVDSGGRRLSDGITIPVTVVDETPRGQPR